MKRLLSLVSIFVGFYVLASVYLGVAIAAPVLHDPLVDPTAALDDLAQSKRQGWPVVVLAAVTMLALALGKLGQRYPKVAWLAFLARGRAAVAIGAIGAIGFSCYNAAADGGSWTAIGTAALFAVAAYLNPHAEPTQPPSEPPKVEA